MLNPELRINHDLRINPDLILNPDLRINPDLRPHPDPDHPHARCCSVEYPKHKYINYNNFSFIKMSK